MTQDLESAMNAELEGQFFTYPGYENWFSYDKTDPLQVHYAKLRQAERKAARKATSDAKKANRRFSTRDAVLTLRPFHGGYTSPEQERSWRGRLTKLLEATAQHTKIPVIDITGQSRLATTVHARHLLCYLARQHTNCSLPHIGDFIGRDHSSVAHGVNKVTANLPAYQDDIDAVESLCFAKEAVK